MFVLLFGYVFGSGMIVPGGGDYREFLMPGMFVMTMAFGIGNTMTVVATDIERGVMDRFRSMPIAPAAVVAGPLHGGHGELRASDSRSRSPADSSSAGRGTTGWPRAARRVALLLLLRFACLWIGIWLGLMVGSPEAAGCRLGPAVPAHDDHERVRRPGADAGLARASSPNGTRSPRPSAPPASCSATRRSRRRSWIATHAVLMAVVWPVAIPAVFFPLSVRRFQRLSR